MKWAYLFKILFQSEIYLISENFNFIKKSAQTPVISLEKNILWAIKIEIAYLHIFLAKNKFQRINSCLLKIELGKVHWLIIIVVFDLMSLINLNPVYKDTNRKIRKTEFIYICGSKNGSSSSAVNTGGLRRCAYLARNHTLSRGG